MIRKVLLTAAAAVAFSAPAFAADMSYYDLPRKGQAVQHRQYVNPLDWSGLHVGAFVGYGWGTMSQTPSFGADDLKAEGVLGGVKVEMLRQTGAWVYGVGADWAYLSGTNDRRFSLVDPSFTFDERFRTQIEWTTSAYLKGGYLLTPALLMYVQGGGTLASMKMLYDQTFSGFGLTSVYNSSSTTYAGGWVFGGGISYMFAPSWTADLSYIYTSLNNATFKDNFSSLSMDTDIHQVRLGVSYKF